MILPLIRELWNRYSQFPVQIGLPVGIQEELYSERRFFYDGESMSYKILQNLVDAYCALCV